MLRYMPDPYPDELIYSVWARFSDHAGYPSAKAVFQDLFGDQAVNPIVDLPCHLQKFCNNLPTEVEFDVDAMIDHHTLFSYYGPFLSPEKYMAIRQQMSAGSARAIYRHIGLSRLCAARPAYLRYCPICLETDRARFGERFWHRLHQAPGVEICSEHEVFLENSPFFVQTNLGRWAFVSAQQILTPALARDARSSPLYVQFKSIAVNTLYLLTQHLPPRNGSFVREQYQALLAKQNYLTLTGAIRTNSLLSDFVNFFSDSLLSMLHCELDRAYAGWETWLNKLVRGETIHYPLFHVLALLFLKSSVQQFFQESLSDHRFRLFGQGPWPCLNPVCSYYKQLHIQTCRIRQVGIREGYSGVFSCDCGFTYSRIFSGTVPGNIYQSNKILAYGPLWQETLCELWQNSPLTLAQIAQRLGVSAIIISRQVITLDLPRRGKNPGHRKKIPAEAEIAEYHKKWLKAVAAFPNEGRHVAAHQSEGAYQWLRKYDPVWLGAHLPPRKVRQNRTNAWQGHGRRYGPGEGVRVQQQDWEAFDRATAEAIVRKTQELLTAPGKPQQVTFINLRRMLPSLRVWPWRAASLPLTKQALEDGIETAEHFASRRVLWVAGQHVEARKPLGQRALLRKASVSSNLQHTSLVQAAIQETMQKFAPLG